MSDEKRILGMSKDGRTLRSIANTTQQHPKNEKALHAIANRLDRSEIERLRTWQPMDSAPRDGTEVLLRVERRAGMSGKCLVGHYMPGGHCIGDHPPIDEGWYFWTGSMFDLASRPIVWMPISEVAEAA